MDWERLGQGRVPRRKAGLLGRSSVEVPPATMHRGPAYGSCPMPSQTSASCDVGAQNAPWTPLRAAPVPPPGWTSRNLTETPGNLPPALPAHSFAPNVKLLSCREHLGNFVPITPATIGPVCKPILYFTSRHDTGGETAAADHATSTPPCLENATMPKPLPSRHVYVMFSIPRMSTYPYDTHELLRKFARSRTSTRSRCT